MKPGQGTQGLRASLSKPLILPSDGHPKELPLPELVSGCVCGGGESQIIKKAKRGSGQPIAPPKPEKQEPHSGVCLFLPVSQGQGFRTGPLGPERMES